MCLLRNVHKFKIIIQNYITIYCNLPKKVCTSVACNEFNHLSLVIMTATWRYCLRYLAAFHWSSLTHVQIWLQYNVNNNGTNYLVNNTTPSRNFIQYFSIYNIYTTICLKSLDIGVHRDIAIFIAILCQRLEEYCSWRTQFKNFTTC